VNVVLAVVGMVVAFVVAAALSALSDILKEEIRGWIELLPGVVLRMAAMQLDAKQRVTVYRDEWLPELMYIARQSGDRPITRLFRGLRWAGGLAISSRRVARNLRRGRRPAAPIVPGLPDLGLLPVAGTVLPGGPPPGFLAIPVGQKDNGAPLVLDLKEAAVGGMGPHGMLVGAPGSGKSELLRSLTASLAARHDPALLNLLLIDFRSGAAFAEAAGLPHVAGLVTNLADDLSRADRIRLTLTSELARRQEILRLAGNLGSIRDYQDTRASGKALPPLPYLVVIVDGFGELLTAKPDLLDAFLALVRLGRSLGMHLLLATHRPDEARLSGLGPHLRYRLCLRTRTPEESRAVLGSADACELPLLPGFGYLQVDREQARFRNAISR
jgi:S-DNA-T family DNA segregation ATPase FtsK/SpoIIIE